MSPDALPYQAEDTDSTRRRAAALAYQPTGTDARLGPRVIAKGERLLADEIIERARAAGVPVHESRELVSLLMQVDLDEHIPPALYMAVAEVLAWAYRLAHKNGPAQTTGAEPKPDNRQTTQTHRHE